MEPGDPEFSTVNGRDVFARGGRRIWRCPTCAWWRSWNDDKCCGCGALRDAVQPASAPQVKGRTFSGAA